MYMTYIIVMAMSLAFLRVLYSYLCYFIIITSCSLMVNRVYLINNLLVAPIALLNDTINMEEEKNGVSIVVMEHNFLYKDTFDK